MRVSFRNSRWLTLALALGVLLPGAATAQHETVPALYPSQAEAEKAAKLHFHCTGAHRMGDQWMPCSVHGAEPSSTHAH